MTIAVAGLAPIVFAGSGYYDTPIGETVIDTPAGQGGVPATVGVEHSSNGGATWQPSEAEWNDCIVQYYRLVLVASEDAANNTWDDATTCFSWLVPPDS